MKIEVHLLCYNESDIMAMVIGHYKKFCDRIIIHDNFSTDSSQLIAESLGCDVLKFGKPGILDDQSYLDVKNNVWIGSESDFIIIADMDEILYIGLDDMDYLKNCGATIIKTRGWNVYSNDMPKNDLLEITTGYEFHNYSKSIMFSPKDIKEMNYEPGAHKCNPVGNLIYSNETFNLLHYKHIGGIERLLKRNRDYMKRMSANNKRKGWGSHYWQPEAQTRREFAERLAISKPLI